MNIMVLVGQYHPRMSANGVCIDEIIRCWKEWGHSVDVICFGKSTIKDAYPEKEQVHTIRAIDLMQTEKPYVLGLKRRWCMLKRKISILMGIPFWPVRFPLQSLRYYKIASEIIKTKRIDQVVSTVKPIESMVSAYYIKRRHPDIKWIIYELDTFINGFDKNKSMAKIKKLEERCYICADRIVHMKSHDKFYQQQRYDNIRNKFVTLDIPLISKRTNQIVGKGRDNQKERTALVFLYSGILRKNVRQPEYAIEMLINFSKKQNILVKFYSRGSYESYLEDMQQEKNSLILRCGYVEQQALYQAISDADILISIGNSQTDSIPSKLFMYMSTCKPIIHFYNRNDDACLKYLKRYTRVIFCDSRISIEENVNRIASEIPTILSKPADNFDSLTEIFILNTPEHSAKALLNVIENSK